MAKTKLFHHRKTFHFPIKKITYHIDITVAFSLGMNTSFPPKERSISQDSWQFINWLINKKRKTNLFFSTFHRVFIPTAYNRTTSLHLLLRQGFESLPSILPLRFDIDVVILSFLSHLHIFGYCSMVLYP